jgi:hypothetical protein
MSIVSASAISSVVGEKPKRRKFKLKTGGRIMATRGKKMSKGRGSKRTATRGKKKKK